MSERFTLRSTVAAFVLLLLSASASAWGQPAPTARSAQPAQRPELARQWKEVRAKYPLVAAAHLELLEANVVRLAEERRLIRISICELSAFANSTFCRTSTTPPEPKACKQCRPAAGPGDIEDYLGCLEERIRCLTP